ncbi:TIGR03619 family F420-dependent LLM class oxidoreductase [Streptosporangium carneum]|uniref:LLM class F420-dependent oxidoreductase n=1 Tax=Streptosporangium carneum TaxID=47481 RepID=A0A9W6MGE5_9ACTN|nr:TIGR03619 family F420-dependent LLM class oxidoreductase [Streptosporangium carneum]GLK13090.1 LLM class F420-dependent oxidoreductase [Streptosporangium carneum]
MSTPRIGVALPSFGPHAGPEAIVAVAQAAERLGFHSVSASERLLLPAGPDWRNEMGLPETYVWETLETLTWAAAHTRRIRLGTGIVNALFQPPITLARRLATIDRLSGGRLDVGLGQGWLPEEFTASGVPATRRGAGFEEYLAALRACWGPDPVEHDGTHYRIPTSTVGPKPLNGLPVYIGALARPAVERAARIGDGLVTAVRDWESSATEIGWYRQAGGAGPVILRIGHPYEGPDTTAETFVPSALADLKSAAEVGADELHFELNLAGVHPDRQIDLLEALAKNIA